MRLDQVKAELGNDWSGYQQALQRALANDNSLLTQINNYLIKNAGKQLRPVLSLLSARACGEVSQTNYECAAVCEIIHTATLLHDDVADNGNLRRGVPTVKAAFNQAASILTGDFWLSRGLHILMECSPEILKLFTVALEELSVGEIIQMEKAEKLNTTIEDYYKIIACKTASLFVAAVKSGAIAAASTKEETESITRYAYHLGLAFQMRDDIFDYSPNMDTGKLAGADLKERKITLPLLCAFNASPDKKPQIINLISGIENTVTKGEVITESDRAIIEQVNAYIYENNGLECAQTILEGEIAQAIGAISNLRESDAKTRLIELAQYVGKRKN